MKLEQLKEMFIKDISTWNVVKKPVSKCKLLAKEFEEYENLLKECLYFMNNVPNNKYDTIKGNKNHYELCRLIPS